MLVPEPFTLWVSVAGGILAGVARGWERPGWAHRWWTPILCSIAAFWVWIIAMMAVSLLAGEHWEWFLPPALFLVAGIAYSLIIGVLSCLISIPIAAFVGIIVGDLRRVSRRSA